MKANFSGVRRAAGMLLLVFWLSAGPANALEYQWKFFIPAMSTPEQGLRVFEILETIQGVYDVDINPRRSYIMFFCNDELTDEDQVKERLNRAGYTVERIMLLEEPREGVMN